MNLAVGLLFTNFYPWKFYSLSVNIIVYICVKNRLQNFDTQYINIICFRHCYLGCNFTGSHTAVAGPGLDPGIWLDHRYHASGYTYIFTVCFLVFSLTCRQN